MSAWLTELLALTSQWELLAVLLAAAYVVLAIRQSLWCWPAAAISASIYTGLFIQGSLYMESALQLFYVVMAGYGFYSWVSHRRQHSGSGPGIAITTMGWRTHLLWLTGLTLLSAMLAWLLSRYTDADMVWLDTPTTVFSLFATVLVARRVLENWLYWIVIDFAYVALFWSKGFYPTAVLFAVYTLMAFIGYWRWRQSYQAQQRTDAGSLSEQYSY
ncbi:nicotinamide mononucleotide transporter [Aliidiomarina sedimenti]|uniref:Nicotinamide riboside transporter PnuC n=1 Tax=Aliidiomarina sedimenti TaxID=1933879 RepID=A0ABY0BY97_9GAMM|nr:nicotinamide riboside transporter PnuC [Aliidiomarina sedimenti]RUO29347.1 nicotinamide mononucleotide transporter [Aliidiomarina sedimenti]